LIISRETKARFKLAYRFIRKNGTKLAAINLIISLIFAFSFGSKFLFGNAIITTIILMLLTKELKASITFLGAEDKTPNPFNLSATSMTQIRQYMYRDW
jgi:hypothetical protein